VLAERQQASRDLILRGKAATDRCRAHAPCVPWRPFCLNQDLVSGCFCPASHGEAASGRQDEVLINFQQ
jgi:hypothetical protein